MGNGSGRWKSRSPTSTPSEESSKDSSAANCRRFRKGKPMGIDDASYRLLVAVFARLKDMRKIGETVMLRVLSNKPELKRAFGLEYVANEDLIKYPVILSHADMIGEFLRTSALELSDAYAVDYIRRIGVLHVYHLRPGMPMSLWDDFKQSLIDCVVEACPKQFREEFRQIWIHAVEYIIWQMKRAFFDRLKREHEEPPVIVTDL